VLLLHCVGHQLLLCALRADDVLPVRDEALTHHAGLAGGADEAVVVPMPALERDEPCATDSCDRFAACCAPLREEFAKAVRTVRLVVPGGEALPSEGLLAVGAGEAFPVPGVVAVSHSSLGDHLAALDALRRELLLVALGAVDVVLLRDEALGADGVLAGAADEALLVPLTGLVLHLLHTSLEHVSTPVTPGGKLGVIARSTVDSVRLRTKLLVHKTGATLVAKETGFVPMLLLVGEVFGVDANDLSTLVAVVGKDVLVTLDAVGMIISQDIPVPGKAVVAVVAKHRLAVLDRVGSCPLKV